MRKNTQKLFPLSKAGKLSALVALNLAGLSAYSVQANGIKPVDNQTVTVKSYGHGTDVINIAAPSSSGLSHNKYTDYNVSQAGAVLNNATQRTNSVILQQLLDANPNLTQKQAANVILNEVVSSNPSSLLGQQEVLGKSADLILANPNGITCDGCGFINTNRAGLVVGKADVQDGNLQGYTIDNNNSLQIGEKGISADKVLDLIAPKLESKGLIKAKEDLQITLGHNYVDSNYKVSKEKTVSKVAHEQQLDSTLLGGMQAKRITLVSTKDGSGVNLNGGDFNGEQLLSVDVNGKLVLDGIQASGQEIKISAKDLTTKAKLKRNNTTTYDRDNYSRYYGAKQASTQTSTDNVTRTTVTGKNISVKIENNVQLNGTRLSGNNIDLTGGNVSLNSQIAVTDKQRIDNNWYYSWVKNTHTSNHNEEVISSEIIGSEVVNVKATKGDLILTGSKIVADHNLTTSAAGNIKLHAQMKQHISSNKVYRKNDTAALRTGTTTELNTERSFVQSSLQSKQNLGLQAEGQILLYGANVRAAQNLLVDAKQGININSEKSKSEDFSLDNFTYWGGIGGGANKNNNISQEHIEKTIVSAGKDLLLSTTNGNVKIKASNVNGANQALVQSLNGTINIDSIVVKGHRNINERNGTAFNITSHSEQSSHSNQQAVGSEVKSKTNLKIVGTNGISISGSLVSTAGELGLTSLGDIQITSVATTDQIDRTTTDLAGQATANQTDRGQYQYQATVGIKHSSEHEVTTETKHTASSISGGTISVNSRNNLTVEGSNLNADKDLTLAAKNISVTDVTNSTDTQKNTQTVSVGIGVEGGAEKSGVLLNVGVEKNNQQLQDRQSQGSTVSAGGNLTVTAEQQLTNRGTSYQAGEEAHLSAATIDNQASQNSHSETNQKQTVGTTLALNADYSAVTRPIIPIVEQVVKEGTKGVGDAVGKLTKVSPGTPNAGVELDINVTNGTTTAATTTANATQISAGSIQQTANQVQDQATNYTGTDGVTITADNYQNSAVENTSTESSNVTSGGVHLRVYTTTGKDVNVDVSGKGKNTQSNHSTSTAVTGNISSENGNVIVKTQNGATFEATQINAGNTVTVQATAGDVTFKHVTNTKQHSQTSYNASAGVKVGRSSDDKSVGGSLGGGYQNENSTSTTAGVSTITAHDTVISANGNANFEGTKINSSGGKVAIQADGDVNITQVINTANSSSQNYQGGLSINQGRTENSEKTSSNVSGGLDGTYATKDKSETTGIAGGITSANTVTITSGRDVTLQGVEIGSETQKTGDVNIQAQGNVNLSATTSSSQEHNVGVNLNVTGFQQQGYTQTSASGKRNIGGSLKVNYEDQHAQNQTGGAIHSTGDVQITSQGQQGITAQGTQISGENTTLNADNGSITLTATANTEQHVKVGVGVDLSKGKVESTKSATQSNVEADSNSYNKSSFGAKVNVDVGNSNLHTNATVTSTNTSTLNSHGDITLAGATVSSNNTQVTSQTGGITVESKRDSNHQTKVDVEFRHSNNEDPTSSIYETVVNGIKSIVPGKNNKDKVASKIEKLTDQVKDKVDKTLSGDGQKDPSLWKKATKWVTEKVGGALTSPAGSRTDAGFNVNVVNEELVNNQSGITATDRLSVTAKGDLDVTAAQVTAPNSEINVGNINTTDLDQHKNNVEVGLKGSSSVAGLVTQAITDLTKGKIPLVTVKVDTKNDTVKAEVSKNE
ncbi:hypothetical protein CEP49_03765 [Mergibacter septicus]|uniref:hemagglutinin repeat-containing protein n=1 Tax=Mergibacter septicus TaxID=221402 RepID=UPI0011792718|nr:hemagglutinin repeat-containing protein [Mergibacter septicus]AWX13729.1 hypothetical protein CEP49_03765 [Mergibacter septicus]